MKKVRLAEQLLSYDSQPTPDCPLAVTTTLYTNQASLDLEFEGTLTLSSYEFYQAVCPELEPRDYHLSEHFLAITERFPATNQARLRLVNQTYEFCEISVYFTGADYLMALQAPEQYVAFLQKAQQILDAPTTNQVADIRKKLLLDGSFAAHEQVTNTADTSLKQVQDQLLVTQEYYHFGPYTYAAMIAFQPEQAIASYEAFHEAFGRFVYSVTLKKGEQTIPLVWPDYLYHQPENHLEFGVLVNEAHPRYAPLQQWQAGEKVDIEILATGFAPISLTTYLKEPLAQRPAFTQREATSEEVLYWSAPADILAEIQANPKQAWLTYPDKTKQPLTACQWTIANEQLCLAGHQFTQIGTYRFQNESPRFGTLLTTITIQAKGASK